jgi:hypothetical protein
MFSFLSLRDTTDACATGALKRKNKRRNPIVFDRELRLHFFRTGTTPARNP